MQLERQTEPNLDYNDHFYRQRLRALQSVDELVDGVFTRLEAQGLLDNTYVFYSSDNGFHIGQHRLQPGKSCGYEEDIHIPLIVRGPGVAANFSTQIVTSHTDLAATFFELAKIPLREDFDGSPFPVTRSGIESAHQQRREHVNVEYWGFAGGEGKFDRSMHENNTYKAIRISGSGYNLYYSIWCNNEHELYDMDVDPGQLNNLLLSDTVMPMLAGHPAEKVIARLDSLLFVQKSCKGKTCREPWKALHPFGEVLTLQDALSSHFDHFYEVEQRRVEYNFCSNGYLVDAEGPMFETEGAVYGGGNVWPDWI